MFTDYWSNVSLQTALEFKGALNKVQLITLQEKHIFPGKLAA